MRKKRKFSWFGNNLIDIEEIEAFSFEKTLDHVDLYAHTKSGAKYFIECKDNKEVGYESIIFMLENSVQGEEA